MSNALVSVILPIYNAQPYLRQCLESVCAQTYENLEIICLNDGSTDDSLDVMREFAARDSRVVVIDKENQGYGASCNRGFDEAHGTWVSIVEPDDWVEPGMYADMLAFAERFEATTPLDVVKCPYWHIWQPDTPQQRKLNCSYKGLVKPAQQPFAAGDAPALLEHHPSIWSAIYRTSYLREKGIRFMEIPGAGWADNPFLIETLCQTERIGYLDKAFYCYREESPEKSKAFAQNNTLLPFERWENMADVLDRIGVNDQRVRRAHNRRGFLYYGQLCERLDSIGEQAQAAIDAMFARMDAQLVFADETISPAAKQAFAKSRGIDCPSLDSGAYKRYLVKNGLHSLKTRGVSYTLQVVKRTIAGK